MFIFTNKKDKKIDSERVNNGVEFNYAPLFFHTIWRQCNLARKCFPLSFDCIEGALIVLLYSRS